MNSEIQTRIFQTPDALSEAAANFILQLANEAIEARGRFSLVLSGGNTPQQLFARLASAPYNERMPWKKIFVFWGDERCVPLNNKDNNAFIAISILLDKVNISAENIFRIPVNLPPAEAANEYEKTIRSFFGAQPPHFDLILLGLGENGHTASLFPNTAVLDEKHKLVSEVYVEELSMYRVTMTAPLINMGRNILFLVAGEGKAAIVQTVMYSSYDPHKYPAQLIQPINGMLYWFLDEKASSKPA